MVRFIKETGRAIKVRNDWHDGKRKRQIDSNAMNQVFVATLKLARQKISAKARDLYGEYWFYVISTYSRVLTTK